MENPYMYIFVRNDLSHPQQIVQAAHSAYEMGRAADGDVIPNVVLIGVSNEDELMDTMSYLVDQGIDHTTFFEPDVDSFTAIATRPLTGEDRKPLKRFKLKR